MSVNKLTLRSSVLVDDWTVERAIIAGNYVTVHNLHLYFLTPAIILVKYLSLKSLSPAKNLVSHWALYCLYFPMFVVYYIFCSQKLMKILN